MAATTQDTARVARRWFYVWMAAGLVVLAFGGFTPSFWAKVAGGTFTGKPVLYVHGLLFFSWTILVLAQTTLAANGRLADHRAWGLAGISLATAMAFSVVLVSINSMKIGESLGMGDQARRWALVPLSNLVVFVGFVGAALLNIPRPEAHKRLMVLSMVPLAHAAIGRVVIAMVPHPPGPPGAPAPVFIATPFGIIVDLMVVVAMFYDWRTRGRPHPAYLIGGAVLLTQHLLFVPVSGTPAWMAVAKWVESLAG